MRAWPLLEQEQSPGLLAAGVVQAGEIDTEISCVPTVPEKLRQFLESDRLVQSKSTDAAGPEQLSKYHSPVWDDPLPGARSLSGHTVEPFPDCSQ